MRESRLFIILISLVMGLAGCSKETMIGEYVDRCAVRLDIDWGPCGIDPDGMTALFYPVDGGEPSRFLTNTVTGDEVRLRKGIYNKRPKNTVISRSRVKINTAPCGS